MKINWLQLETRINGVLNTARDLPADKESVYDLAILMEELSEIMGQELGRGYVIGEGWSTRFIGDLPDRKK